MRRSIAVSASAAAALNASLWTRLSASRVSMMMFFAWLEASVTDAMTSQRVARRAALTSTIRVAVALTPWMPTLAKATRPMLTATSTARGIASFQTSLKLSNIRSPKSVAVIVTEGR